MPATDKETPQEPKLKKVKAKVNVHNEINTVQATMEVDKYKYPEHGNTTKLTSHE